MPAQSLDNQILQSLPLLEKDQKKSILTVIKSFLKSKEDVADRISIEQYNKEMNEAESLMEAGEIYTIEEVKEVIENYS
jgi:hypothetical protein